MKKSKEVVSVIIAKRLFNALLSITISLLNHIFFFTKNITNPFFDKKLDFLSIKKLASIAIINNVCH